MGGSIFESRNQRNNLQDDVFALLGLLGAAISVTADLSLAYFPEGISGFDSAFTISLSKIFTVLSQVNHSRLIISHYLAIVGIPLSAFGLWFVGAKFKETSIAQKLRLLFLILGGIGFIAGIVFHTSLSYIATIYRLSAGFTSSSSFDLINLYFSDFSQPLAYTYLGSIIAATLVLISAVLAKQTIYPCWVAIVNPLSIELFIAILAMLTSLVIRTFLIVTIYNFSLLISYAFYFSLDQLLRDITTNTEDD